MMGDPFAVHLLPATGEWVYDPRPHRARRVTESVFKAQNRFARRDDGRGDVTLALDQLQATYPGCRTVSLVCAWFGNSTDVTQCQIYPSTTFIGGESEGLTADGWVDAPWRCSSLTQHSPGLIPLSQIGDSFVYGGTPSDPSIVRCLQELRTRGFRVMFYPFLLMDCVGFPWRGRIALPGSDRVTDAAEAVATFLGSAAPEDFIPDSAELTVAYAGAPTDYTYRRMILHYAHLCAMAGGVDLFLIGSELRGLEAIRGPHWTEDGLANGAGSATWDYPFVDGLIHLARDVRVIFDASGVRPDREARTNLIAYSADWSNWMGVQHQDAQGQWPHLDALYASEAIDVVSFDNYMPLSDWTTGDGGLDARHWRDPRPAGWPPNSPAMHALGLAGSATLMSKDYLKANIEGGDKYAWFYRNSDNLGPGLDPSGSGLFVSRPQGDRLSQARTAYAPGQELLANKMVRWWWSHQHRAVFDTGDGQGWVPRGPVSAWQPFMKSITFAEYGFPTCDRCTNQPNVFFDPKSVESFTPFWSAWESAEGDGRRPRRDDLLASLAHEAITEYWTTDGHNAVAPSGQAMIDTTFMAAWNWDARPFPIFPQSNVWGDAANWRAGTWLTGKGPTLPPPPSSPEQRQKVGLVLPDLASQGWTISCAAYFATETDESTSGKETRIARSSHPAWRIDLSFEDAVRVDGSLQLLSALYARTRGSLDAFFMPVPLQEMGAETADYGCASEPPIQGDDAGLASAVTFRGDYGSASKPGAMAFVRFAEDDMDAEIFMRNILRVHRVRFTTTRQ